MFFEGLKLIMQRHPDMLDLARSVGTLQIVAVAGERVAESLDDALILGGQGELEG